MEEDGSVVPSENSQCGTERRHILAWFAVKLLSVDGTTLIFYRSTFPLQSDLRLIYNFLNACYPVAEESKGVVSARLIFMPSNLFGGQSQEAPARK